MFLTSLKRSLILTTVLGSVTIAANSWPSFHNGGNTSIDAKNLPVRWTPEEGTVWKTEIPGYGQSSPVIWNDRIYLTAIDGENKEQCLLFCVDFGSGNVVWKHEFPSSISLKYGEMVSRAAPTPLVDARGIFVFFESGDLHALSHDGDLRWQKAIFDSSDNAYKNNHGYGASPAQTDDAIIVLVDHTGPSYLLAIAKETGKDMWKTDRTSRTSWSSPRVARIGEQDQVVVSSGGTVDGYDATTGKQLWTCSGITGNTIPSATIVGNLVFVGASQGRGGAGTSAASSNCCVRISPEQNPPFEVVWKAEKAICSYVSPLYHRGYVYYVNSVGVLYCLDATDGRQCYAERIDGTCWAQPIAAGDVLYFFGKKGITTVVRAGETFEVVSSNRLWTDEAPPKRATDPAPANSAEQAPKSAREESMDPVVYGVAAVDDAFIVRLGTHLYRIGGKQTVAEK